MHELCGEYVDGLQKADMTSFPVMLRNLRLKPAKVNEELEDVPFNVESGSIGLIKITPGWTGYVDVEASGIKVNLSFSPSKAASNMMKPQTPTYDNRDLQDIFMTGPNAPGAVPMPVAPPTPVAPRFCSKHDTSDKRVKGEARECICTNPSCRMCFTSTYAETTICPPCSQKEKRCLICGAAAEKETNYIPPNRLNAKGKETPAPAPAGSVKGPPPVAAGYGASILQPTDSIKVADAGTIGTRPVSKPAQVASAPVPAPPAPPMRQAPPAAREMQQGGMRRARQAGVRQEPEDDSFLSFLRGLGCGALPGLEEEEEYDMPPPNQQQRQYAPPQRGRPPG